MPMQALSLLNQLFRVAVARAQPSVCLPPHLHDLPEVPGRLVVLGAGKASAAMAQAVEATLQRERPDLFSRLEGLVLTRYGYQVPCERIEIVEASHPVPDQRGLEATQRMLQVAQTLGKADLVLCLISGGGSALLTLPAPGISLDDKQMLNRQLLHSGATIHEMNCVRKHLSAVKGGRLAQAIFPAQLRTLAISDVPGDDLSVIASGPTVADESTFEEARQVLACYALTVPKSVQRHLESASSEALKPGARELRDTEAHLIATPQEMLEAVAAQAREWGITPLILSDRMEGEAREVAKVLAAIAQQIQRRQQPVAPPAVLLSGGETTVTVRGDGRGGRNTEFALALLEALQGCPGISAIACDTDGIDGTESNAGACFDDQAFTRAQAQGLAISPFLARNDAYSFFEALGGLVESGPTFTNVNDFRAIFIEP